MSKHFKQKKDNVVNILKQNNINELANIMSEFKKYGDVTKILNLIDIDNISDNYYKSNITKLLKLLFIYIKLYCFNQLKKLNCQFLVFYTRKNFNINVIKRILEKVCCGSYH